MHHPMLRVPGLLLLALPLLAAGCEGMSFGARTRTVHLNLSGEVRTPTGAPVAATVRLFFTRRDLNDVTLASAWSGPQGRYTLAYRLREAADIREFQDECVLWHEGMTVSVNLDAYAPGYSFNPFSRPALRCTDEPQTIHIRLEPNR